VVAEGSPNELKGELRGDAIHVELGDPEPDGRAHAALDRVPGVWEVTIEGRSLRAGPRTARRPSRPCSRRWRPAGSGSPR
jgi:hypothetical protein